VAFDIAASIEGANPEAAAAISRWWLPQAPG
jgi:hypothetical protein